MKMIPFNVPLLVGTEETYLSQCIQNKKISGDGPFTQKCHQWFEQSLPCKKALLTTSCTHALEMAAILIDIKPGDEVIMPSYTFVSTANAFILHGAKVVFVDVRSDTMNIDETLIESAITEKTKAIVPVHYAGVACEMDAIMQIASKYQLYVIEDAAQGVMASYKDKPLGTIGHFGCFSFHETKNYNCGEGGALIINDEQFIHQAEIIREKGTNRSRFLRGMIDKYSWVDIGSSYLPSELNASFLFAQLQDASRVNDKRLKLWNRYYENLEKFQDMEIPYIPNECVHNAHMFYIKLKDIDERGKMIDYLKSNNIQSVFHYIPLHHSKICNQFYKFNGLDNITSSDSERLLRLPLYYGLEEEQVDYISNCVKSFFN